MPNEYILRDSGQRCVFCKQPMRLLSREDARNSHLWFYICFRDSHVEQLGKGAVPYVPTAATTNGGHPVVPARKAG